MQLEWRKLCFVSFGSRRVEIDRKNWWRFFFRFSQNAVGVRNSLSLEIWVNWVWLVWEDKFESLWNPRWFWLDERISSSSFIAFKAFRLDILDIVFCWIERYRKFFFILNQSYKKKFNWIQFQIWIKFLKSCSIMCT